MATAQRSEHDDDDDDEDLKQFTREQLIAEIQDLRASDRLAQQRIAERAQAIDARKVVAAAKAAAQREARVRLHLANPRVAFAAVERMAPAELGEEPAEARDEVVRFIGPGAASTPLVHDALQHLAGRLWCAMAALEPKLPAPTRELDAAITQLEGALGWLCYVQQTCGDEDGFQIVDGAVPFVPLLGAAHGLVVIADLELRRLHAIRDARRVERSVIGAAGAAARGARGPLAGPEQLRGLIAECTALRTAGWSLRQIAELVIVSATWRIPPCPTYVARLLERVEGIHERAIHRLADLLSDAARRVPQ